MNYVNKITSYFNMVWYHWKIGKNQMITIHSTALQHWHQRLTKNPFPFIDFYYHKQFTFNFTPLHKVSQYHLIKHKYQLLKALLSQTYDRLFSCWGKWWQSFNRLTIFMECLTIQSKKNMLNVGINTSFIQIRYIRQLGSIV